MPNVLTTLESQYCTSIKVKDECLRKLLDEAALDDWQSPEHLFEYLTAIKDALGNLNNDLSFVATLLAKNFLVSCFKLGNFDAALKPQGAPGIDIEITTEDGLTLVGEIKTTNPYQPGFGAAQKASILKDMKRLSETTADHRFMFVTNNDTFKTLCSNSYKEKFPSVVIVNLITRKTSQD